MLNRSPVKSRWSFYILQCPFIKRMFPFQMLLLLILQIGDYVPYSWSSRCCDMVEDIQWNNTTRGTVEVFATYVLQRSTFNRGQGGTSRPWLCCRDTRYNNAESVTRCHGNSPSTASVLCEVVNLSLSKACMTFSFFYMLSSPWM